MHCSYKLRIPEETIIFYQKYLASQETDYFMKKLDSTMLAKWNLSVYVNYKCKEFVNIPVSRYTNIIKNICMTSPFTWLFIFLKLNEVENLMMF